MEILKISEAEVATIGAISYLIVFDPREHKATWRVEFSGDRQAVLSSIDRKPIEFATKQDAEKYCIARWPELHRIDSTPSESRTQ